ncbi:hypothetical protein ACHAO9_006123 [Fusarium lateritium]
MSNDFISIIEEHKHRFQGKYTHITTIRPEIPAAIRQELTRDLSNIILDFEDEMDYVTQHWPKSSDWTTVPLYEMMVRAVALLSSRSFIGLPLSREEAWLQASIGYTVDCVSIRDQLHAWNPILQPIIGPFLPSVRSVRKYLRLASDWMTPLIKQTLEQEKYHLTLRSDKSESSSSETRGTFISWLLRHLPEGLKTPERVGVDQMLVSFAAIHTTTAALTKVIWELAKRPEYINPLRAEIEHFIRTPHLGDRNEDLGISKQVLYKLYRLDSFIKEVQRWCPSTFVTPSRRVMKPITLSNGIKLPKGASIAWPAHAIHMSLKTPAFSPECNSKSGNPPPTVFEGFRYANLRAIEGQETRHQAVATGFDYLVFNHGKHACPGRFFAIYEIKIILIKLLMNYDFRLVGDVEQAGGEEKGPKVLRVGTETRMDNRACMEIRKRKVGDD